MHLEYYLHSKMSRQLRTLPQREASTCAISAEKYSESAPTRTIARERAIIGKLPAPAASPAVNSGSLRCACHTTPLFSILYFSLFVSSHLLLVLLAYFLCMTLLTPSTFALRKLPKLRLL